jgi:hypothetical protein
MTQDDFDRLPLLLRPAQAREVLGCDRDGLLKVRKAMPELAVKLDGMKEWRYRKVELAKVVGLKM